MLAQIARTQPPNADELIARMPKNPYQNQPKRAFWRSGVASHDGSVANDIYRKKWPITADTKIATAGSCFAQHIGRQLKTAGYQVLDVEPAPDSLPTSLYQEFGYGVYSARYGNIYTVRQLLQLAREALGFDDQRNVLWEENGRWFDGLRPTIEPVGHPRKESVIEHRSWHLARVKELLSTMDLFVFTLGLTEAWVDNRDGTVFPVCPGTVTDDFDGDVHTFKNFSFSEILSDFLAFRDLLKEFRGADRTFHMLLTVSPVPLTATAVDKHVQVANVYSKSVLRSVAGELADNFDDIDYFPSYEIVTNPWTEHRFYAENLRSVTAEGVACVMKTFMQCHGDGESASNERVISRPVSRPIVEEDEAMLLNCDEELLDAFGPGSRE